MLPKDMVAITIKGPGGPEVLVPEKRPVAAPGPGQVLIEVSYAGINRHDCGQRRRGFGPKGATDIPGLEVAGTIVATGEGVAGSRVGQRVCALVNGGGYAEYCLADAFLALRHPENIDDKEAASLPEGLFTTWFNVVELGRLKSGDWLLVHGGTSGVGSLAIQIAKRLGAKVIVTAGSPAKCGLSLKLGADRAVNYRVEDFVAAVEQATGGHGADVIFDMVGGDYGERNLAALAMDGRIAHIKGGDGAAYSVPLSAIMGKRAIVTGSQMRPLEKPRKQKVAADLLATVWPALGSSIRPLIDSVLPLEQAAAAHARMETGDHAGKILLKAASPRS